MTDGFLYLWSLPIIRLFHDFSWGKRLISLILSYLLYFVLLEAILFVQLAFEFGTFRLQQHKPYFFSKYIYSVKSNIARLPTVCWSTLRDLSESPEVCWIPILIYFWWFDDAGGTLESDENLCFCFTYV